MTNSIPDTAMALDLVADTALAVSTTLAAPATAVAAVEANKAANPDFAALGLTSGLLKALDEEGYTKPTPIQAKAIPPLLTGRDLLGLAETGTGKTAAFALPILQMLKIQDRKTQPRTPRALILAPTRELAIQIGESLDTYGRHLTITHTVVFGGVGSRPQMKAMDRGVDIVVATPGRLLDLISTKHISLEHVTHFVLDEADRMLDMGFIHDVRRVVRLLPKQRQSLLFSATMPDDIASLAADLLRSPARVEIERAGKTVDRIEQRVHFVGDKEKRAALVALLQDTALNRVIVFTRTKRGANRVARTLEAAQIGAHAIHGNKSQNARQAALDAFKAGEARVLVATDIAARGIDIDDISHVINYELPNVPESYVHRIGRTARAGANGVAIALCSPDERSYLRDIERLTKKKLQDAGQVAGIEKFLKMPEPPARKDEDEDKPSFERGARKIDSARRNNRPFEKRPDAGGGRDAPRGDRPSFGASRGAPRGATRGGPGGAPRGDRPDRPRGDRPSFGAPRGDRPAFGGDRGDRKPFQSRDARPPRTDFTADTSAPAAPKAAFDPLDVNSRRDTPRPERRDDRSNDRGTDRGADRGERKPWVNRGADRGGDRAPRGAAREGGGKPWENRGAAGGGERKPWVNRDSAAPRAPRSGDDRRGPGSRAAGPLAHGPRADGERKPWVNRDSAAPRAPRTGDDRRGPGSRPAGPRADGERKPWVNRDSSAPRGAPRSADERRGPPRTGGDRPGGDRPGGDRPFQKRDGGGERKPWVNRDAGAPRADTRGGDRPRPRGPRPDFKRPDAPKGDGDAGTGGA